LFYYLHIDDAQIVGRPKLVEPRQCGGRTRLRTDPKASRSLRVTAEL
jgi:hypothetical protein